jgi:hypothetical protein
MMATPRISHGQRELDVLQDLEASFPNFTGRLCAWTPVPEGQDPPDFISKEAGSVIGLELREWLDGEQMAAAKAREIQRALAHGILNQDWERHRPNNFCAAFPSLTFTSRISREDQQALREQFFAFASDVDHRWFGDLDRHGRHYYATGNDFEGYPMLAKYFSGIRFIEGDHVAGLSWIHQDGDGGAYDPNAQIATLRQAFDAKLQDYSRPDAQAKLSTQGLTEFHLLVHGGFNIYAYNTPPGDHPLNEISRHAGEYFAAHALRDVFNRVWFFLSLNSDDELNGLLGFPPGSGRVRFLAQLWPEFRIVAGSFER